MFSHNKKFDSVENAVFFLLCSSIGSWDPSVFNREQEMYDYYGETGGHTTETDVWMGRVFLMLFVMFDLIVLLNLVIAILAGTYS